MTRAGLVLPLLGPAALDRTIGAIVTVPSVPATPLDTDHCAALRQMTDLALPRPTSLELHLTE
jgi:hypothetical protein